ncbi:MAG: hypothetical protein V4508_19275 [Pseudomonadota bacterium]
MRRTLLLLTPLLLAGCVNESASYFVSGNEHTLTVRAEQDYFWQDEVTLKLIAARLPDCQRQFTLGKLPATGLVVELFAAGDNVFTLRAGKQLWQIETQTCTQLAAPAPNALGDPLGSFKLSDDKMVFEAAAPAK